MTTITKGLNVPISGEPQQLVESSHAVTRVALLGDDYIGMKPTMLVNVGDRVKLGQPVFTDKKTAGVTYTAPAAGTVVELNRGAKRRFESLVIEIEGDDSETFETPSDLSTATGEAITEVLTASGLWSAFRTRPFGKVPLPGSQPHSIFVQAIDTHPLAADPSVVMRGKAEQFAIGLNAIKKLTSGKTFVCKNPDAEIPGANVDGVTLSDFSGPHPAGLPGTHIHFLDPVGPTKTVWYIGYQDVIAIGHLFETGKLDPTRIISLAGPCVAKPRLLETRLGADLTQLTAGELEGDNLRIVSGSVLGGRTATEPCMFLGRYHTQVSVLQEGNEREFLGWQKPGFEKFSITRVFASALTPGKRFAMNTGTHGSERAMVPIGSYERVMPLDILPTQLLRSLIVRDTEEAQQLGALELEEEDLALCTFVCPGKYEFGEILRENLTTIEIEG
ncbi:Na(+)-translocating NADH-quinone reductase subunit A [Rosistilla carotiformis]|uniref:Na(+)-translocating NADH-quinone reductase subunit A n=1 Tax=Rosistilla carotiformis TaxID=2528017 RepID=A0A518JQS6_9BACT|nr:Na(+)-translocating NADH-quinone reductase subunit A [Rosistilla carotiformis]QDV67889.1 Na(+)-translocating NADH-quinone reductase subunit A [Rosistilla carotiformis]